MQRERDEALEDETTLEDVADAADEGELGHRPLLDVDEPTRLGEDELELRTELASVLLPSAFPARAGELRAIAEEAGTRAEVLALFDRVEPSLEVVNVGELWRAAGHRMEERPTADRADEAPAGEATPEREAPGEPASAPTPAVRRFRFAFSPLFALVALPLGIRPASAWVEVGAEEVVVRFGPWTLRTATTNVVGSVVTGPYSWWRTIGPPHLSLADRGITFATNDRRGVCLHFDRPVPALLPIGIVRHPGATITVEDPEGFVAAVEAARGGRA